RGAPEKAGPIGGARASLVEEKKRLAATEEEHRIPARKARLVGCHLWLRPGLAVEAGQPDFHVVGPLLRAAEPRGQQPARLDPDHGGSVARRKWGLLEDEHSSILWSHFGGAVRMMPNAGAGGNRNPLLYGGLRLGVAEFVRIPTYFERNSHEFRDKHKTP